MTPQTDITVEKDTAAGRFLLTAKTDRGRDWLGEYSTATSQWWGKSLIVARWEIDAVIKEAHSRGLTVTNR